MAGDGAIEIDRRQHIRVVANGSVIVSGDGTTRGRLSNISGGGMLMRHAEAEPSPGFGEQVDIDLHLDRTGASWLRFRGDVVRADPREVAISFTSVPLEFVEVVQDALTSALEGASLVHVLLVDSNVERRVSFAALLRRTGCRVAEVATPLDTIAYLGSSSIHSWVVAIASTVPTSHADELRKFLAKSDTPVAVRMLSESPTTELAWFTAVTERPD